MKTIFSLALLTLTLVLPLEAQVLLTGGQGNSARLDALEAPKVNTIASNATTAQIDFRQGVYQYTNGIVIGTADYEIKNLANAITLQLTNLVPGVQRRVWITTDGTARAITVSTNGLPTQTRISYNFTAVTNGATTFTATNRAFIDFRVRPVGEVYTTFGWEQ